MSSHHLLFAAAALAAAVMAPGTGVAKASAAETPSRAGSAIVHYKTVQVDGMRIFYREAGDPSKPTILLLHGFPTSSHMYRNLIPLLADHFHLVAPDYPGAGFSEAPESFQPTFKRLAEVMGDFVETMGLNKFTIYMQDFGGPVGFRIASAHPEWVDGLIIQNANAYEQGISPEVLKGMKDRANGMTPELDRETEGLLSPEGTIFQYRTGARDFVAISPDSYGVDSLILGQPGPHRIQKGLLVDYYDNVLQYPTWHAYLRQHHPRTLIVWGKGDPIFLPAGAEAYRADLPDAELHFYDTGHFALEEDGARIAAEIIRFHGG